MIKWEEHPEMVEFMINYIPGHQECEIRAAFNQRFGIILTEGQIGSFKHKHKVKSGTTGGQYKPGNVSHNKGKKVSPEAYAKMKPTMFKKGNIPVNHKPVGSERINTEGYIEIKVAEPNKWKPKHRVVWEDHHKEKIGRGEAIIMIDGNKRNTDLSNLRKITRSELVLYNRDHQHGTDADINELALNIARLKDATSKRKKKKEEK